VTKNVTQTTAIWSLVNSVNGTKITANDTTGVKYTAKMNFLIVVKLCQYLTPEKYNICISIIVDNIADTG